jgi:hypothetical protein
MKLNCAWCKSEFEAQRSSAKFCSDACKTANHRYQPMALVGDCERSIQHQLKEMTKVLKRSPQLAPEVYSKLSAISNQLYEVQKELYPKVVAEENGRLL